ncbi:MAG: GNAT family protein [Clostridia bacterium]
MLFESTRLIIRPFAPSDYAAWSLAYENRLPPQNAFDVGAVARHDKKYYYDFITAMGEYARADKIYVFGAFEKATGLNVGILELITLLRNGFDWGSVGVSIHNQFWRHGFGLEIAEAGVAIAKDALKFRRLECAIEQGNLASVNLFSKLGFEFEATRKQFAKVAAEYVDMDIYSKLL